MSKFGWGSGRDESEYGWNKGGTIADEIESGKKPDTKISEYDDGKDKSEYGWGK
jgi:hypothetical protein